VEVVTDCDVTHTHTHTQTQECTDRFSGVCMCQIGQKAHDGSHL